MIRKTRDHASGEEDDIELDDDFIARTWDEGGGELANVSSAGRKRLKRLLQLRRRRSGSEGGGSEEQFAMLEFFFPSFDFIKVVQVSTVYLDLW